MIGGLSVNSSASSIVVQTREASSVGLIATNTPVVTAAAFSTTTPTPMPAIPRASPDISIVSAKLFNSSTPPTHQELASYQVHSFRCF
jgi:hypothetical protein